MSKQQVEAKQKTRQIHHHISNVQSAGYHHPTTPFTSACGLRLPSRPETFPASAWITLVPLAPLAPAALALLLADFGSPKGIAALMAFFTSACRVGDIPPCDCDCGFNCPAPPNSTDQPPAACCLSSSLGSKPNLINVRQTCVQNWGVKIIGEGLGLRLEVGTRLAPTRRMRPRTPSKSVS